MSKYNHLTIGVLAIQGDFERHQVQLHSLGVKSVPVRMPKDLTSLDALIMPGGESTTINIMLDRFSLREPLSQFIAEKPVWGTCAGMIMLAANIDDNLAGVKPLAAIDIDVLRNGYGRQVYSFEEPIVLSDGSVRKKLKATFIRAPRITRTGSEVVVLAEFDGSPILVRQNRIMASSFHTELDDDTTLLEYFLARFLLG